MRNDSFYIGGDSMSEQKKRVTLVDVVLERKGSMLFEGRRVKCPYDGAKIIRDFIGDCDREKFVVLCLNTKNEPTALQVVHTGSLNASIVHPRDVFKVAVLSNSASVVVAHNHPSGSAEQSPEDVQVTERLVQAGRILGIDVLDHLIITHDNFKSLKEEGLM